MVSGIDAKKVKADVDKLRREKYGKVLKLFLTTTKVVMIVGILGFVSFLYFALITGALTFEVIFLFLIASLLLVIATQNSEDRIRRQQEKLEVGLDG